MNREFIFNLLLLVFINLLVKPFFIFGIDLTVQNRVAEGDYGLYFTLFNFTYLFQILNDFGIQNFNNRNLSQHPQLLPKYFPNLLALKALLSVFYFVLAMLCAWAIAGYGQRALLLLSILLLNQILMQGIFFLRSNISGLGFYRIDSLFSSLDKLLMLATCSVVLWANPFPFPFSIEMFALAQTVALLLTAALAFIYLRILADRQGLHLPIKPSWAAGFWKMPRRVSEKNGNKPAKGFHIPPFLILLFKKSYPYALVILLMTAYTRLDAIILERMLPDGRLHADVYAGAYRLLDACNMLGYLFASLLLPMFAKMLKTGDDVRALVSLSTKIIWAASITLVMAIFFSRQDLVQLMMHERASAYRWAVLGVLIWTFVPVCLTYIFSTLLTANESLMQMNRFFVAGIVLDVALNLLLIPRWQALGAAMATVGTQLFIAVAMIVLCVQTFKFRPSWGGLGQVVGLTALVFMGDFYISQQMDWGFLLRFLGCLSMGLGGVFIFKILNINELKHILLKK